MLFLLQHTGRFSEESAHKTRIIVDLIPCINCRFPTLHCFNPDIIRRIRKNKRNTPICYFLHPLKTIPMEQVYPVHHIPLPAHTKRTPPQQCPPEPRLSLLLCPCAIFDGISIAWIFDRNKEVKRKQMPVKMYVGNQEKLSTTYKNNNLPKDCLVLTTMR